MKLKEYTCDHCGGKYEKPEIKIDHEKIAAIEAQGYEVDKIIHLCDDCFDKMQKSKFN